MCFIMAGIKINCGKVDSSMKIMTECAIAPKEVGSMLRILKKAIENKIPNIIISL